MTTLEQMIILMKFGKFYQKPEDGFIFQPFRGNEPLFNLIKGGYLLSYRLEEVVEEVMGYLTMDATAVK